MKMKSRNYSKPKFNNGYVHKDSPLYDRETFLYYFENRLKEIVKDEVEANFKQVFFNMPY